MTTADIRLGVLVFTVFVNLLLAAFVYKNNSKSATNTVFGALAVVTSLWLIDVYLSVNPHFEALSIVWVRLSIFFAAPQIFLFFLLSHTLPHDKIQLSDKRLKTLLIITLVVMLDAVSPFAFSKTEKVGSNINAIPGIGLPIFVVFAFAMSVSAVVVLYRKLKHTSGYAKEQIKYVFTGILIMLGLLSLTILLPVAVFKSSIFIPFVPLYTLIFLGMTTYAIVRHHLFDIRAVITKSVTYVLLLLTLTTLYGVFAFKIGNIIFGATKISQAQKILNIALAILLGFSIQPLKDFFEKLTDRVFYRDKYDPQILLNDVSHILASEIDMKNLTSEVCRVIKTQMRVSDASIVVLEKGRIIYGGELFSDPVSGNFHDISLLGKNRIFVDNISEGTTRSFLENHRIRASVPLRTRDEFVGYFLLGEKLNGEVYSSEDERILLIIGAELAVAISNAKAYLEIQQFNVTLQEKVDNATRELRKTNEKLKDLDEAKDEFISMASHQLRTPLTTVKGYISMVQEGDGGKITAKQKNLLDQAFSGSQRMVYLIADLLNVSRLQTGKFVIENAPTNLADVVEGELAQLAEPAKSHNLKLIYKKPKHFPLLMLDETKIRQVIMNFTDNAIYYTPSGGTITVSLVDKPDTIECTVVDTGIGVPKSEEHHLFSKFYRAGNARKARPDGTGLGLFMAKKVIIAQGGALIFRTVEGKGSTFGFSFSKAKLKVPAHLKSDPNAQKKTAEAMAGALK